MNSTPDTLIEAYLDGELDSTDLEALKQWIAADQANAVIFLERVEIHRNVRAHFLATKNLGAVGGAEQTPTRELKESAEGEGNHLVPESRDALQATRRRSLLARHNLSTGVVVAFIGLAALLTILAFTPVSRFIADQTDDSDAEQVPAQPLGIATLTNWHRPEWIKEHAISPRNHRITAGQKIAFTSGIIELTYDTGAKVVIEGPAEFVAGAKEEGEKSSSFILHPSNSGYLALGRLVARCDSDASQGFTIDTPSARLVDMGTEFGVLVRADGDTDTHVFDGKVVLEPRGEATWPRRELLEGQSFRFAGGAVEVLRRSERVAGQFKRTKQWGASEMLPVGPDTLAVNIDDGESPLRTEFPSGYMTYTGQGRMLWFASEFGVDGKVGVRVASEFFRNIENPRYGVVTSLTPSGDPFAGYNAVVNSGALVNHESKGPITVAVEGLTAGSYRVRFFMHCVHAEESEGSVEQGLWDISGTAHAKNVRATFGFNRPTTNNGLPPRNLDGIGQTTLNFGISNRGDDATFTFRTNKLTASRQLWVNGFELTKLNATKKAVEEGQANEN
ncbi:MAG: FecR family protein [Pirellulales bacterium]|nr:FecR family protein [Pirellulales bacterium]